MSQSSSPKVNSLRGIMRNKKLSQLIRDAYDAPIGSTKRKQAEKIVSIIRKTSMDGKGGPGLRIPQEDVRLGRREIDYSNIVVFPAAPKIKIPIGAEAPPEPEMDGAGGPGDPTFGSLFFPQPQGSTSSLTVGGTGFPSPTSLFGQPKSPLGSTIDSSIFNSGTQQPAPQPGSTGLSGYKPASGGLFGQPSSTQSVYTDPLTGRVYMQNTPNKPASTAPTAPAPTTSSGQSLWNKYTNPSIAAGVVTQPTSPLPTGGTPVTNATDQPGNSAADYFASVASQQNGGGPSTPSAPGSTAVQDAVNSGIPGGLFAFNALSKGGDYLKGILGDNVSDSMLQGGLLSDRIAALKETLKKEYQLEESLNQWQNLIENGVGLNERLTDYIRGRDEFLNETDGMIQNLRRNAVDMDMSDPVRRKSFNTHLNYLYELRGRQNKRYIEVLNASVNTYDSKLKAAESVYNTQLAQYNEAVQQEGGRTIEEYNQLYEGLKELHANIAGAKKEAIEAQILYNQLEKSRLDVIKLAKEVGEAGLTGDDGYINTKEAFVKAGMIDKDTGVWNANDNANLVGDPRYRIPVMIDHAYKAMTFKDDKTSPSWDKISETGANVMNHIKRAYDNGEIDSVQYGKFVNDIRAQMTKAMVGGGIIDKTAGSVIKSAIEWLANEDTGYGRFNPFSKGSKLPSKEEFLKKFNSSLEKDTLNLPSGFFSSLYSDFERYMSESSGLSRQQVAADILAPDGQVISDQDILDGWLGSYMFGFGPYVDPNAGSSQQSFNSVGGDTDPASLIAKTIRQIESGGDYTAPGKSGEYGAYQFTYDTWKQWAGEFLGNPEAPLTPENQDKVAIAKINSLIAQGYTPEQIFLIWNGGTPTVKSGVNSYGVSYDTGAYAQKALAQLQQYL